jgi:hypothetical protein
MPYWFNVVFGALAIWGAIDLTIRILTNPIAAISVAMAVVAFGLVPVLVRLSR